MPMVIKQRPGQLFPKGPFWWTMPVGLQLPFPTQRNGYMKQLLEIDGANVCRPAPDRNV